MASSSGRYPALVVHSDGDVLDFLTRWFEASGFDVMTASSAFRAQSQLEAQRAVDVVVAPWDIDHAIGGDVYRWVLGHRPDLRTRFVFIADEVPPEFDAVIGGRCLAVPLAGLDELTRVAAAVVRRVRTPPRGLPIVKGRPTLLVADDDPALLVAIAELLHESGYAVSQADSGQKVRELLGQREFDAIVLDWHMHDARGGELFGWIAAERPQLADRVVFLSETDGDDSGPVAPGRPMLRKGQDSQALLDVLREIVKAARG